MITAADIYALQKGMTHWVSEDTERWCPDCDQTKAITEFYKRGGRGKVTISPRCKSCDRLMAERRRYARAVGG